MDQDPAHTAELVRLPDARDAHEVVYALRMRRIEATPVRVNASEHGLRWAVMTSPDDAHAARGHLAYILDVMLPERADDGKGNCLHCGYSLAGLAGSTPNCPECGEALRTIEARFRARRPR
ncbi:MAG: hypothetical protein ACF8Q5_14860 [Phycisphaerales bacterium JB040]